MLPRFFFFQAEDGIRDRDVTGVQTCALPISPGAIAWRASGSCSPSARGPGRGGRGDQDGEIGRASCRERVEIPGGPAALKKRNDDLVPGMAPDGTLRSHMDGRFMLPVPQGRG